MVNMNTKSVTYKCKYCNRQIKLKDIDVDENYMCPYCGNTFTTKEIVAHSISNGVTSKKYILKVLDKWYLKSERHIDITTGLIHIDNYWYPYSVIFTTDDFKEFIKLIEDEL